MTSKNKLKYVFIAVIIVMAGFALADALGFFNEKSYTEVSHGSHIHYVPHDRDPEIEIHNFPMQEPGPNQRISPTGQLIRAN